MDVFNKNMTTKNQIHNLRLDVIASEAALVEMPKGRITEEGIRKNINVGILYIESWLRGNGAAAIYNLMEDAATAEISRTQVWLWLHKSIQLENQSIFNEEMYQQLKKEELEKIKSLVGERNFMDGKFKLAIELFDQLVLSKDYKEFLTLSAYKHI
jgi:malate synthase